MSGDDKAPVRVAAVARRPLRVGAILHPVHGGEWLVEPNQVEAMRGNDGVDFVEYATPEQLEKIMAKEAEQVARMTERLRALGYVVLRDGEQPKAKKIPGW